MEEAGILPSHTIMLELDQLISEYRPVLWGWERGGCAAVRASCLWRCRPACGFERDNSYLPRKRLGGPWLIATVRGVGHRSGTGPDAENEERQRG